MRGVRNHLARTWWVWASLLLPFGFGSWGPAVPGVRCGVRRWVVLGLFWPTLVVVALIWESATSGRNHHALAGALILVAWTGGFVMSLVIRREYVERCARGEVISPSWPQPTARSRGWSVRYAVVAFIVTFGAVLLLQGLLRDVLAVPITVGAAVLIVDATLLAALVPLARKQGVSPADLGLRRTLAMRSLGLALLTLLAYVLFAALYAAAFIGRSTQHSAGLLSGTKHLGTVATIVAVVAIAVSAPVVEEIFFRGLLYRSMRNKLPTSWAALIAGSMFGLVHIVGYPLVTVPIKGVFGVLACVLYEKTGSILPGIAVHSFVDATAIDVALTGNDNVVLIVFGSLIAVLVLRWCVLHLSRTTRPPRRSRDQSAESRANVRDESAASS